MSRRKGSRTIRTTRRRRPGLAQRLKRTITRHPLWQVRVAMLVIALLIPAVLLGCPSRQTPTPVPPLPPLSTQPDRAPTVAPPATPPPIGPLVSDIPADPVVRVRVAIAATSVTLGERQPLTVGPPQRTDMAVTLTGPITITKADDAFLISPAQGQALRWQVDTLYIKPAAGSLKVDNATYPGLVYLHAKAVPYGQLPTFDVVNHAVLDDYLPGVLAKELYAHWHPTTFRAQAIAARTYALHERWRNRNRSFDMEASQASQAYVGITSNAKARDAVQATAGLALTYDDRVFAAYYSSSTGGSGQDAAIAFPNGASIPPLRGFDQGTWEQGTPHFRWGPITRDRDDLSKRIAAWGAANQHSIARLRTITAIAVTNTNTAGRPSGFRLTDAAGTTYTLTPEQFRFACNYQPPTLPALPAGSTLKSSHVTPTVAGAKVLFTDGRGYGHGVGMSQYGAQSLATRGYAAEQIVAFYYPGAQLRKVY